MGSEVYTKINQLVRQWPKGTVAVASFLVRSGFSRQLLSKYTKGGWIQPFGRGAYVLLGDQKVGWPGALFALQTQMGLKVYAGGKTALELKGYAHFLSSGENHVFLYGRPGLALHSWF
jgi:hypothetical protein